MSSINICIIDDHKIVRQGLKQLLEKLGNIKVITEFENGEDFLAAIPLKIPPDIYILDYSMPNLNGIEVLKQLGEKLDEFKVLLLTQHFEENIINDAYHFGARGFLHKNCSAQELKFAIDSIAEMGYYNISEILKRIKTYQVFATNENKIILSEKHLEFLQLVCDEREFTYEQMGDKMGVSVKTIDGYRIALFEKYQIKSKIGLVLFSFKNRLTIPFL